MGKKKTKDSESPCEGTFESLSVNCKTPATAVLLLRSPEEDILIKVCETIYQFAEKGDENKVSILGLGALAPLCQLITHNNKLVIRNAFRALGSMAINGDVKSALKKIDVIPSIINKLLHEDTVVQEFATLCLVSLSLDFEYKVQIFDNKGLPPLIGLLSSPDPDVQKNSIEILFNLIQDHRCRVAVRQLGGIPPSLELLSSRFPVIQRLALETLRNVTMDKDACNTFWEEQGFEKLIAILTNKDFNDLHAEALHIVTNCLRDSESVLQSPEHGDLYGLTVFFLTTKLPEVQLASLKCITRMAQSSESRTLLHEQNVEKALVELLSVADNGLKTCTCEAVAAMSSFLASKDRFRSLGGLAALVQGLSSESVKLREAATQALCDLTHNNVLSTFAVYEAGGHELLIQQLYGSCPRTVANAVAILCHMARQETIRCIILSNGAVKALVQLLKTKDSQVLVNTMLCLAVLVCDTRSRGELLRAGGFQPLVNLLQSSSMEVLQNAYLAIKVFASDEPAAVEMCKFGAIEMLQEINQSVHRRSHLSEVAMISLLNSNLSVKYGLTGHLVCTDTISSGFYDAGEASEGERILTLQELSKEPLNQRRPVIVVNTTTTTTTEVTIEEDKQKDNTQPGCPAERPWKMMDDVSLQGLVKETKESILLLDDERERFAALARLVSEAMGGTVEKEKFYEFSWELHLSELRSQLQSNVIPIGLINRGIYCHRALLFKFLADGIGMNSTLNRGEYNRAWNEVQLFTGNSSSKGHPSQPSRYIVDLMHRPGSLLAANTAAAEQYKTI